MKIIKINQYKNIAPLLGKQCRFGSISGIICGFKNGPINTQYILAVKNGRGFNMECFQKLNYTFFSNINNEKGYFIVSKSFIIY